MSNCDPWYTYLSVRSKPQRWMPDYFGQPFTGGVAVLNVDAPAVPRNMPCALWYTSGTDMIVYHVRKWQPDPKAGVDVGALVKPEDGGRWAVRPESPLQSLLSEIAKALGMDGHN